MPKADQKAAPEAVEEEASEDLAGAQAAKAAGTAQKVTGATRKAKASLLSAGRKLDETEDYVNGLWMGDQGTGKTTDLMRMANLGPIVVISAEGGVKRIALRKVGVDTEQITVLPSKPEDLTFNWLEDLYWELAAKLQEDPDYIVGVCWDSLTEIVKVLLRNVVDYQLKRAAARGESRIKNAVPGDILNQSFTDLGDYGVMTDQVRKLLRLYRDLPCHFGVSTLMRRDMDDDGRVVYNPAVTPAVQTDLVGMVDVIAVKQLVELDDGGEDEYQGLFRPAGKYRGKDRFKQLPKHLVDPHFDRVVGYIVGELNLDNDEVMAAAQQRRASKPKN